MALDTIQYGAFVQSATYSIANQLGFFTATNLNVIYNQVASSTDAFASLFAGDFDILTATFDNALNFRLDLDEPVAVLGQLDQGPDLVVASVASVTNISQLQGKPLMVDSPVSGYSFLLQHVLSTFGLELAEGDFSFQVVGGTNTRFADLVNGTLPNGTDVYATILTYPFTLEGAALPAGEAPNVLARIADFVAPVTSSSFMARTQQQQQPARLTRFVAAMLAANRFLLDPRNADCSIGAIASELDIDRVLAAREYASATDGVTGEISPGGNFTVNMEGAMNDVMVRADFGGFSSLPADFDFMAALEPGVGKLIDYTVRDAAVKFFEENRRVLVGNCSASTAQSRMTT